MHYLQAQRLWKFRTKYLKFNRARYETKNATNNYASLSNGRLDSLISYHFDQAKILNKALSQKDKKQWEAEQISWLSSSPLTFLFKPTLFDIISYEQISAISKIESSNALLSLFYQEWLPLSQDQMVDSLNALAKRSETKGSIFLFLRWLDAHKTDPTIYYFIETLLREHIYKSLYPNYNQNYQKQYEAYLASIISSPYPEVKARAIHQLCVLWKEWSLKYAGENYGYANFGQPFDTTYEQYAVKAVRLYDENNQLFKNYGFLQQQLEQLRTEILFPKLQILFGNEHEKNKPLLLKVQYKNVPVFYYRIVRLNFDEELSISTTNKEFLLSHEMVEEEKIDLPLPVDYNPHRVFLKLPALSSGNYCLVFSKEPIDSAKTYSYQSFVVSDLAFLHTDDRVYVLNRGTGMPVKGAFILATSAKKNVAERKFRTNEKGFFILPLERDFALTAIYNGDTLRGKVSSNKRELPDEVFSKEEYEDLVEYYDENSSVMIFTDRGIYRPGQKVFFKAVVITKNPSTGEMMIMSEQNLRKGFRNYLKKWVENMEPLLYLEDAFGRNIDSVKLKPNSYGSVSGYFTIPKNASTGDWNIVPDYLDTYRVNNGEFKVEEYKRPTFELTVDKPSKNYKIGDTLSFRVKLKSFSGSILNHSLVKYQIERRGTLDKEVYDEFTEIDSSGFTNEQGVLDIRFFDTGLHQIDRNENINLDYNLTATVTDVAGETHEVTATLKVSTKPVVIRIPSLTTIDLADLKPIVISAKDKNEVPVLKNLWVKLYRLSNLPNKPDNEVSSYGDQWIYTPGQLEQWFPNNRFIKEPGIAKEELVFETMINTADFEKFRWPDGKLVPGAYKISVSSLDDGFINGESSKTFAVFNSRSTELPNGESSFFYLQANYLQAGDTLRLFSGSKYDTTYLIRQVKYYSQKNKKEVVVKYYNEEKNKGIYKWEWKVPSDVNDNITLSEVYVVNNKLYRREEMITIYRIKKDQPEIVVERFRSQLHPGDSAVFSVSIKTKNENIASELMTTIYDASLDKLATHQWQTPVPEKFSRLYSNWPQTISTYRQSQLEFYQTQYPSNRKPVWWMDTLTFSEGLSFNFLEPGQSLGKVPGIMVTNGAGLNEVVVVGYGTERRSFTVSALSVQIRGISSLEQYKQPLIILDGVPFTADLSSINMNEVTAVMILKDEEAAAIYGSKASNGVLIISTKGEIVLPTQKQEPVLKIRSNFNETAFFSPAVHADKNGYYTFSFTMPESVTEWHWKIFAHTKSAMFAYAERKLLTQLPLMVQPHLPVSLYQGDRIILKTRVSNLDTLVRNGVVSCKVEDAVTGEELTTDVLKQAKIDFAAGAKSTTSASFELEVPEGLLHPLKVIITARTNEFADGEEHIIPVLSKKILVKQNQSVQLFKKDTLVSVPQSFNPSNLYGVELSIDPKPQTALLNSLPYLAHYSFDCAEQMFNKLFAHAVAVNMVRRDTAVQNLIRKNRSITESNFKERSPDSLIEQTMPWLALAEKQVKEQLQLAGLLDTMKSKDKIWDYLEKLFALQNSDGGISWFEGGKSNSYISAYILAGFGRLTNLGWNPDTKNGSHFGRYEKFIQKLCGYCDDVFLSNSSDFYNVPWFAYARSFWAIKFPASDSFYSKVKTIIDSRWSHESSIQAKALLIITAIRYFSNDQVVYSKAIQQLQSLMQSAIVDGNGIRWKAIADADDLETSAEESLALVIEALEAGKQEKEFAPGIIKWLMTYKNEQQWHTTKGAAAVIDLLLKEQNFSIRDSHTLTAAVNDKSVTVSDDILYGSVSAFHQTENVLSIHLRKQEDEPINANIGWYHFGDPTNLNDLNKEVSISKNWYHLNSQTKAWELSDSNFVYKVGEKARIVITVETSKALRYVWINDKRSAAFEPEEYNSGYRYGKYFGYYQSIRDAGLDFFAEFIPSGKTEIEYEMVVTQEGKFSGGMVMLQCMYKPSVTSYSNTQSIISKSGSSNFAH
ncbi:MAG TPA: MG2 domain-containing protein [Flavisolibacter sp.]|nr:MG2 domain-containing protein [Flavisolibacter sp.]